jgi:hypothetical protein
MRIAAGIGMAAVLAAFGLLLVLVRRVEPSRPEVMSALDPSVRLLVHRRLRLLVAGACFIAAAAILLRVLVDP